MSNGATPEGRRHDVAVVIVGTGFAGLGTAIKLKQAGIDDFVLLEKANELGGTWRDNTYPGCACDVPSMLYSFSFEQNPEWSRVFAPQAEIAEYLQHCADKYGLREHIHYGVEFTGAEYDEETFTWHVATNGAAEYTGRALVSGVGGLHLPSHPELPGISRFEGSVFHSAEWDHDFDPAGKRIAVIGTGASAIQFIPPLAKQADELHVFQRSAAWVQPKPDWPIPHRLRRWFRRVPLLQRALRAYIYGVLEARFVALFSPRLGRISQALTKRHIRKSVRDPKLREAVTPDYAMGCKRIVLSNDYYSTLERDNVELRTDGVTQVRERTVVTGDGSEYPVDAIIYGTGFHVSDNYDQLEIVGRDGRKLRDVWRDGMHAHLGVTVSGFPNLFFLLGPNTGLAHSSVLFMIESQLNYVLSCLKPLCLGQVGQFDVRRSVQDEFNRNIQSKLRGAVWTTGGCQSWFLDPNGVNRALWPGFTFSYWRRTRTVNPDDFEITAPNRR